METKSRKITDQEKLDALSTVLTFLWENQQYGDDWREEIACLEKVVEEIYEGKAEDLH